MNKVGLLALFTIVVLLTASVYLYDELRKEKMKYNYLREEYIKMVQQIETLNQKVLEIELHLENSSKYIEDMQRENAKLADELETTKYLLGTDPERVVTELIGSTDTKLATIRNVVERSINSEIVVMYSGLVTVSDAIYIDGQKFTFDYFEDRNLFGSGDVVVNPEWFLVHRVGDCDDVATAMATILKVKGYNVKFCVGHREGDEPGSKHTWVRLNIGDVDYRYCKNRVCPLEVGDFGNIAEKCTEV